MLAESHPVFRQMLRFCALPYCYVKLVDWSACTRSRVGVAKDLLYIFFRLRYYPDNYAPCRLWEKRRDDWNYYYGSSYHPWARYRLRKKVQPFQWISLFVDKARCHAHFDSHGIRMPRLYGVIEPSSDFRAVLARIAKEIGSPRYMLKPVTGASGRGVCRALCREGLITIQTKTGDIPLSNFTITEPYLVEEVLGQDGRINEIFPGSVNTVRVVTLFTMDESVVILSAAMRFGLANAFIDNWSAGGVIVGVDKENGLLCKYAYNKKGMRYEAHPTTGFKFENYALPFWPEVLKIAEDVQKASSFYRLLGLDIALTPQGPVVIEVNANPDIIMQEQAAGPLFKDRSVLEEFAQYGLLFNKNQWSLLGSK